MVGGSVSWLVAPSLGQWLCVMVLVAPCHGAGGSISWLMALCPGRWLLFWVGGSVSWCCWLRVSAGGSAAWPAAPCRCASSSVSRCTLPMLRQQLRVVLPAPRAAAAAPCGGAGVSVCGAGSPCRGSAAARTRADVAAVRGSWRGAAGNRGAVRRTRWARRCVRVLGLVTKSSRDTERKRRAVGSTLCWFEKPPDAKLRGQGRKVALRVCGRNSDSAALVVQAGARVAKPGCSEVPRGSRSHLNRLDRSGL